MSYKFSMPDGRFFMAPDSMTSDQAEAWAQQNYPNSYAAAKPPPASGFFANLGAGAKELANTSQAGIGLLSDPNAALAKLKQQEADNNVQTTGWGDVTKAYDTDGLAGAIPAFGGMVRDFAAQNAPTIATSLAGAETLGAAGSALGPIGTALGGLAGGILPLIPSMAATNAQRQQEANPTQPVNVGSAYGAAAGQSALMSIPTLGLLSKEFGVDKILGKTVSEYFNKPTSEVEAALAKTAQQTLTQSALKGTATGVATAMPTMVAQEILTRWQAGQPLTGAAANQAYLSAAGSGAMFGGILGPVHGMMAPGRAQDQIDQIEAAKPKPPPAPAPPPPAPPAPLTETDLLALDQQFQDRNTKIAALQQQIKDLGKPDPLSAEALEKKQLQAQLKQHIADTDSVREDWVANKAAIQKAKVTPEDAFTNSLVEAPAMAPLGAPTYGVQYNEHTNEPITPADTSTEGYAAQQLKAADALNTGEFTPADQAEFLMKDPEQARQIVASKQRLPGMPKMQSSAILKELTSQLQQHDLAQEAAAQQLATTRPDMAPPGPPMTDPLAPWKESLAQDQEQAESPVDTTPVSAAEATINPQDEARANELRDAKNAYAEALAAYEPLKDTGKPEAVSAYQDVIAARAKLDDVSGQTDITTLAPPADYASLEDLMDRALEPAAGGKPTSAEDLETGVENLADIRKGLLNKYVAAVNDKVQLEDIASRKQQSPKLDALKQAVATAADQAKAKLVASAVEEIKSQRELGGLVPLDISDEDLAKQLSAKVDDKYVHQTPLNNPGISGKNSETPYTRKDQERQSVIDRQLNFVNGRIRELAGDSLLNAERRATGAASAFPKSEAHASELKRLLNARKNLMRQQGIGYGGHLINSNLQKLVDHYALRGKTRQNEAKQAMRKGVSGNPKAVRELVLGGRQFPETTKFTPTKEDTALVQRMRDEEIKRLNDAAQDTRYTQEQRDKMDRTLQLMISQRDLPVTEAGVARAKAMFPEQQAQPDLFREGMVREMTDAAQREAEATGAEKAGKSEVGRALAGMRGKSPIKEAVDRLAAKFGKGPEVSDKSAYGQAKERLTTARAKMADLKQAVAEAAGRTSSAKEAKLNADRSEAQAKLRDAQRTVQAAMDRLRAKQAAPETTPEEKKGLAERFKQLGALAKRLNEELRPALDATKSTPSAKGVYEGMLKEWPADIKQRVADLETRLNALEERGISPTDVRAMNELTAIEAKADSIKAALAEENKFHAAQEAARTPIRDKIAETETAIKKVNDEIAATAPVEKEPPSTLLKAVNDSRDLHKKLVEANTKWGELLSSFNDNGFPAEGMKDDPRVKEVRADIDKYTKEYHDSIEAVRTLTAAEAVRTHTAAKAGSRKYEVTKPFGVAKERPEPKVIKGKYGTEYYGDKSEQTSDARRAANDKALEKAAESGKPALTLGGTKEMALAIPDTASKAVREKVADWLKARGHTAAAEQVRGGADSVLLKLEKLKESADMQNVIKKSRAEMAAAVRMGERQTEVRPQKGVKKGFSTGIPEARKRLLPEDREISADTDTTGIGERPDTLFRTGKASESALSPTDAKNTVDAFLDKAPKSLKDKIEFYPSAKDIPAKRMQEINRHGGIGDNGEVAKGALMNDGKILIVGDAHKNVADLMETLAHEISGHFGVRKLLGESGINDLTKRLAEQGNISEIAKQLGLEGAAEEARSISKDLGESKPQADRRLVEELLGHLEQRTPTESVLQKAGRFVREVMGAINAVLTKMGMRSPFKVTAADLSHILRRARAEALRDTEAATEGPTVFRTPKAEHENEEYADAAKTLFASSKTLTDKVRETNMGLAARVWGVDRFAAIRKAAAKGDPTAAMQLNYDLMNSQNVNHFVHQAVMHGAPELADAGLHAGKKTYKVQASDKDGLKEVAEELGKIKGHGNHQAVSQIFTMMAAGKRAQTLGWDRVFSKPKNATAEQVEARDRAIAVATKLADDLDAGTSPYKDAYDKYQDFNKKLLKFVQQAGVVSQDEYRRLVSTRNYTPLFREDKLGNVVLDLGQNRTFTIGKMTDEPQLRELIGGSGQIMDWFNASTRNAHILIGSALDNIAQRQAVMTMAAIESGEGALAHPVGPREAVPNPENIIEFRKDGVVQRFMVNTDSVGIPTKLLMAGFKGVPSSLPGVVRLMGKPATLLRKTATRTPFFLFRTLIRDPLEAWLATGANFNPITGTLKELGKAATGRQSPTLERRGIVGGMTFANDIQDLENLKKEAMTNPSMLGVFLAKAERMAQIADGIERQNVYNSAIRDGASEIQATLAAHESMPYSRRGTSTSVRYLNHLIPFLNSSIQGWDVLWRGLTNQTALADRVNVRNKMLLRGGMIAGLTALYSMEMANDDKYQKADPGTRLNNWFVNVPGTNETLKFPVPFELGIFFKMIPEVIMRTAFQDKNVGQEVTELGAQAANMVPNVLVPQALLPALEAGVNKNFDTGADIENQGLQKLDIDQRYTHSTSQLSRILGFDVNVFGHQYGVSPAKIEFMASQYTAGVYPLLAALIDHVIPAPAAVKPDRALAQMPMFRSVLLQEDEGGKVTRLYDELDQWVRSDATFKKLVITDPKAAQAYATEHPNEIERGAMAEKITATLNKFSKMENVVYNNTQLTGAQKKIALDNIKRAKSAFVTQFAPDL